LRTWSPRSFGPGIEKRPENETETGITAPYVDTMVAIWHGTGGDGAAPVLLGVSWSQGVLRGGWFGRTSAASRASGRP
jgi:hypothetical protein